MQISELSFKYFVESHYSRYINSQIITIPQQAKNQTKTKPHTHFHAQ